jgi:hypothetical protein
MSSDRLDELTIRLENGFRKIGEAMANQIEVTDWENFWIELLREYEQIADDLAAYAAGSLGRGDRDEAI